MGVSVFLSTSRPKHTKQVQQKNRRSVGGEVLLARPGIAQKRRYRSPAPHGQPQHCGQVNRRRFTGKRSRQGRRLSVPVKQSPGQARSQAIRFEVDVLFRMCLSLPSIRDDVCLCEWNETGLFPTTPGNETICAFTGEPPWVRQFVIEHPWRHCHGIHRYGHSGSGSRPMRKDHIRRGKEERACNG
jgi:hypothetical protein